MCLMCTHYVFFIQTIVSSNGLYHHPKIVLYNFYQGIQNFKEKFSVIFDTDFSMFFIIFCVKITMCVPFGCQSFFVRLPFETSET